MSSVNVSLFDRSPVGKLFILALALVLSLFAATGQALADSSGPMTPPPAGAALLVQVLNGGIKAPTKTPIEGSLVLVLDANSGQKVTDMYTDGKGFAGFKLKPGTYNLYIESKGMISQYAGPFSIKDGETAEATILLLPAPGPRAR
jgi:hypothetical protein